jgi:hypothetical protein
VLNLSNLLGVIFITQLDQYASQPSYIFQISLKPLPTRVCSYTDYTPLQFSTAFHYIRNPSVLKN